MDKPNRHHLNQVMVTKVTITSNETCGHQVHMMYQAFTSWYFCYEETSDQPKLKNILQSNDLHLFQK